MTRQLDEQVGETEAVQQELSISNQELAISRKQAANTLPLPQTLTLTNHK